MKKVWPDHKMLIFRMEFGLIASPFDRPPAAEGVLILIIHTKWDDLLVIAVFHDIQMTLKNLIMNLINSVELCWKWS